MADLDKKALDITQPISEADMNLKTPMAQVRHRIEKAKFIAKNMYYPDRHVDKVSGTINLKDHEFTNKGGSERTVSVEASLLIVARA